MARVYPIGTLVDILQAGAAARSESHRRHRRNSSMHALVSRARQPTTNPLHPRPTHTTRRQPSPPFAVAQQATSRHDSNAEVADTPLHSFECCRCQRLCRAQRAPLSTSVQTQGACSDGSIGRARRFCGTARATEQRVVAMRTRLRMPRSTGCWRPRWTRPPNRDIGVNRCCADGRTDIACRQPLRVAAHARRVCSRRGGSANVGHRRVGCDERRVLPGHGRVGPRGLLPRRGRSPRASGSVAMRRRSASTGTVDGPDLHAVLEGIDPSDGTRLDRARTNRAPGFDLTFSAPKSVSIMHALADTGRERSGP